MLLSNASPGLIALVPANSAHKSRIMILDRILDLLPFGVIIVNKRGKILFTNGFGREILDTRSELKDHFGVLRARSLSHNRALSDAFNRLSEPGTQDPIGFGIARPNRSPLSVVLVRLMSPAEQVLRTENVRIAVFLSDPGVNCCPSASLLRTLFEFTPVEASVAKLMLESCDTAAIAAKLQITRNTLRDHLKSMFSKTNTRNQGELLYALLRCPATLRFHSPMETSREKNVLVRDE